MRSHAPLALAAVAVAFTLVLVGCTAEERPPTAGIAGATHSSSPASNGTTADLDATIQQRDFAIKYVLDGITQAGEEVPVPTPRGLLWESRLPEGAVQEGDLLGTLAVDDSYVDDVTAQAPQRIAESDIAIIDSLAGPRYAQIPGKLSWRDSGPVISATGLDVVVDLTPLQVLRLQQAILAGSATVETIVGSRDVPCGAMWIALDREEAETAGTLHCRLPRTVESAPGLRASLTVSTPTIANAIVVPNSMLGVDQGGYVITVITSDGSKTIPVTVGISDGVVRVVTTPVPTGSTLVPPDVP